MKAIITATLLAMSLSCAKNDNAQWPELPASHTLQIEQLFGQTFVMEWLYDPDSAIPPADLWRGLVEITLNGPDVTMPDFPLELQFGSGFNETQGGCLVSGRGTWGYEEETGTLRASITTETGTVVFFEGVIERSYFYIPPTSTGGRTGDPPTVGYEDGTGENQGNWFVIRGDDCTADDFALGTAGRWHTANVLFVPLTNDPVAPDDNDHGDIFAKLIAIDVNGYGELETTELVTFTRRTQ